MGGLEYVNGLTWNGLCDGGEMVHPGNVHGACTNLSNLRKKQTSGTIEYTKERDPQSHQGHDRSGWHLDRWAQKAIPVELLVSCRGGRPRPWCFHKSDLGGLPLLLGIACHILGTWKKTQGEGPEVSETNGHRGAHRRAEHRTSRRLGPQVVGS